MPTTYTEQIWHDWLTQAELKPLDRWLKNWFKQNRQLSRVQKLNLSQAMFAAMRFLQAADYLEQSFQQQSLIAQPDHWDKHWQLASVRAVPIDIFWIWIQLLTGIHQLTPLAQFKNELPSPAYKKRQLWLSKQLNTTGLTQTRADLLAGFRPAWQALLCQRSLLDGWTDEQKQSFMMAQLSAPPLWLRLNSPQTDSKKLALSLARQQIDAKNTLDGICVSGGREISQSIEYKQGQFEIQDLASQQIALAVKARPGQKVWDACAGAGGKSLAIAARMNNKGSVFATDLHEYKLAEVKKRAKRAGLFNIRTFAWEGAAKLKLPKEAAQQKGFDWVLVDAPCTSAGTWRRNPDAKWRFSEADTQAQIAIQRQILSFAHYAVRPNGHLVYATCSWQVSENEAIVAEFLANHTEFKLVEQKLSGAPEQDSDTMFVAVMQKQA